MGAHIVTDRRADQPEMFGERIWLRPIEVRDALAMSQASAGGPDEVSIEPMVPVSETAFRNEIQSIDDSVLMWAICKADQQEAIGTATIRHIDLQHRTAETGMGLLYEADRGQGYGHEVKALLLDFAFEVMGLHTLMCTIDSRNVRSQRSVERSGYKRAGSLTANNSIGLGQFSDTFIYQLMADEWRANR